MSTDAEHHHTGQRLSYDGALCTVRFIGQVTGTTGTWLGVEWDDPSRGKHDGSHKGVRYFTCEVPPISTRMKMKADLRSVVRMRPVQVRHGSLLRPPHAARGQAQDLPRGPAGEICRGYDGSYDGTAQSPDCHLWQSC